MKKILKESIADIKFTLNRLVGKEMCEEQTESLFLLEKALELVQQAEDSAAAIPSHMDMHHGNFTPAYSLNNSDLRFS